ncbi:DUF2116 family Zn-ribbon domain-containing protein [Candidatus Aciduliprofundum boonei]|uniref:DUF2116 family Zn-ribbon domain-containing protein n=1 Tax=Aciduliprofundum boonei (strain DSM 19572 / T469) TaxID=439481 RepID=B5IGX9_ACIB4|nr:DUF2116 family Zn-ribbon domain-containing protein [Candidatus Aciduliprofundum boonei]ADD08704.1 Protein of unknown function DUF2116, Zn-ribbon [Aciduliprofundum boonei T469]EDY34467.1 hypothetical protein ABOONEI_1441 [Aciduliprofundum boonei T469]HII54887.1 DUF2116 family Zn-ribbon domain-containing protein [Candidatus Aciduliprofundum boonei]
MVELEDLMEEIENLKFEINGIKREIHELTPHKHCLNCGIAIPPDKTFCSKKCEDEWNNMVKKKKRFTYIWLLFLGILLIILMFSMGHP